MDPYAKRQKAFTWGFTVVSLSLMKIFWKNQWNKIKEIKEISPAVSFTSFHIRGYNYNLLCINTIIGYTYCLFHYIHDTFTWKALTAASCAKFTSLIHLQLEVLQTLTICLCCIRIHLHSESCGVNRRVNLSWWHSMCTSEHTSSLSSSLGLERTVFIFLNVIFLLIVFQKCPWSHCNQLNREFIWFVPIIDRQLIWRLQFVQDRWVLALSRSLVVLRRGSLGRVRVLSLWCQTRRSRSWLDDSFCSRLSQSGSSLKRAKVVEHPS